MKKVFLENLPRKMYRGRDCIDWENSKGYEVNFVYDDIEGYIEILDYIRDKNSKLLLKYNEKEILMGTGHFKECKLGNLLNVNTANFKIEIGTHIKDNKRDITIIDRKYEKRRHGKSMVNEKLYKYRCNKCGYECGEHIDVTTRKYLNEYWVPESDLIGKRQVGCLRCKDTFKYPEKFMFNFLNQININFVKEYSPKWSDNKRYDFYFEKDGKEYIIETHGAQHYIGGFERCGGKTLQEEQENDEYKKELALHNGIKEENYIIIDCRKSELEFIKNNILHSRLNEIFDLSNVDWIKIGEDSEKSLVKDISDYWNKGFTIKEISNKLNIRYKTVRASLKKGSKIGWNNYDPKKEMVKNSRKINKKIKLVEIFKDNVSLGVFKNCKDLERQSEKLFGVKLLSSLISEVATGKRKQYKRFTFKYV